jgi:hypothetical protein
MLGQHRLKSLWVSTDQLINLVAALEDEESWHGANTQLGSQVGQLINIKLDKVNVIRKSRLLGKPKLGMSV